MAFAIYPSLKERVVFVTGGGSGIGESIVEHFCEQQSKVAFVDINADASNALVERLAAAGNAPRFIECDIRDVDALQAAVATTANELGTIECLVNNAADDTRHEVADVTVEYWDDRFAINLRPHFFTAQAVFPGMKAVGRGSIINIGSISWKEPFNSIVCYQTAKCAVHGLTRALATEMGPDRVRVNTVIPGWIMTQKQLDLWVDEEAEKFLEASQRLPDKLYPPDIARVVLFLAADDSEHCTAQEFTVDGGWT